MSWFNKNKIVVNTKYNRERDRIWTLINNVTGERKDFCYARWVLEELISKNSDARETLDELIKEGVDKELAEQKKEKFNKHFVFYVGKDIAPFVLNQLDALDCVGEWSICEDSHLENYVQIDYDATRQVLFQTENGVVVKKED